MKRISLNQRSDEWTTWRNGGVTATDARVLLGLDPEKSPFTLWAEKTGRMERKDLSVIPAVRYGVEHENVARELYNSRYDDLVAPCCAEYDADHRFRASFDGIDLNGNPVEFKCPLPDGNTLADVKANKENSEAYKKYYPQIQHQLLVSDKSFGFLVFFEEHPEGEDEPRLYVFRIERDEKVIKEILLKGQEFLEHLEKDTPPERREGDLYTPEGEAAYRWMEAATLYKEIVPEIERLTAQKEALKEKLLSIMGAETAANFGGIAVTISQSKGSVDYKAALKGILQRDLTDEEMATYTKKGSKRALIRIVDEEKSPILDEKVKREESDASHEPLRNLLI